MKKTIILMTFCIVVFLSGCAGTIPTEPYQPQNIVRCEGTASIEQFTYEPYVERTVKRPNQIQNTALGNIYISVDVADLVKRATALELEKTGIKLDEDAPYIIGGKVVTFKADDLGYSVDWSYSINYVIKDKKTGNVLLNKTYSTPTMKAGKFGGASAYSSSVNELIVAGYDLFIRDNEVISTLERE